MHPVCLRLTKAASNFLNNNLHVGTCHLQRVPMYVSFSALLSQVLAAGYKTSSDFIKSANSDAIFEIRQILLTLCCSASYRQCVYAIKWKRSKSRLASRLHLKLCTPAMQCKLQNGKKQHRNVLSHFLLYSPWSLLQDIRHCVILGKQTLSRYLSTVMSPFLLYCTISLLQDIRHHLILWKAPILTPFYNCN